MYRPLFIFFWVGLCFVLLGAAPIVRFLVPFMSGEGGGHIQSLVIGSALVVFGGMVWLLGLLADLIAANRRLLEQLVTESRRRNWRRPTESSDADDCIEKQP